MKPLKTLALGAALSAIGVATLTGAAQKRPPADPCASKPSKFAREQCRKFNVSAPGDEYFGRAKMSYLGINNTFRDQAIRAGANTVDPSVLNKANDAEDSLRAWLSKYPNDPQLARSIFLATETYKKIYIRSAQDKAWTYMQMLTNKFPSTYFGKQVKEELAIGFTQHWYADPVPCSPMAFALPPTPVPPPAPPGRPKYEILTPPCTPATPSPTPSASPSPVPKHGRSTATPTPEPAPSATTPTPEPAPSASRTPVPGPSPRPPA